MPYAEWAGATRDLTTALEQLADGEFVILGESSPGRERRRGLFDRQPRPVCSRYVQALRTDEVLSAECVGASSLGGTLEMADATIENLRTLGWLTPEESRAAFGSNTPNFDLYVELNLAAPLADLMVASLAVLGAEPHSLSLESSNGGVNAMSG